MGQSLCSEALDEDGKPSSWGARFPSFRCCRLLGGGGIQERWGLGRLPCPTAVGRWDFFAWFGRYVRTHWNRSGVRKELGMGC